jgi:NAD(P)-dependent dehydrogenase (short-subunit alcohol dehydrogenase family)
MNVESRVLLVTGCSSGIGLSIAKCAASAGHHVYAGARRLEEAPRLHALCESFPNVTALQLDITKDAERKASLDHILAEHQRLDALVNNAGVALGGFLEQIDEDELRTLFDVNFFATFAMTKACLPHMREAGDGLVVMMSSVSGRMALPGLGAYASSKFALEGLSEALRHECRPFGIRVTLVEPGAYDTDMFSRNRRYARRAFEPNGPHTTIMKRCDERFRAVVDERKRDPEEVGRLVVSLLSNSNVRMRYPLGPGVSTRLALMKFAPYGLVDYLARRVMKSP